MNVVLMYLYKANWFINWMLWQKKWTKNIHQQWGFLLKYVINNNQKNLIEVCGWCNIFFFWRVILDFLLVFLVIFSYNKVKNRTIYK